VKIVETVLLRALSSSSECLLRLYATEFQTRGFASFSHFPRFDSLLDVSD
jgi:hypothetical protein